MSTVFPWQQFSQYLVSCHHCGPRSWRLTSRIHCVAARWLMTGSARIHCIVNHEKVLRLKSACVQIVRLLPFVQDRTNLSATRLSRVTCVWSQFHHLHSVLHISQDKQKNKATLHWYQRYKKTYPSCGIRYSSHHSRSGMEPDSESAFGAINANFDACWIPVFLAAWAISFCSFSSWVCKEKTTKKQNWQNPCEGGEPTSHWQSQVWINREDCCQKCTCSISTETSRALYHGVK